jgi:hypothetical protein
VISWRDVAAISVNYLGFNESELIYPAVISSPGRVYVFVVLIFKFFEFGAVFSRNLRGASDGRKRG